MNIITVWNRKSTNFGTNAFVRANGTNRYEVESEDGALWIMGRMIHDASVDRAILETPRGRLTWEVHQQDEPEGCDCPECDDDCDCGGCPGNDNEEIDPRM